MGFKSAIRRVFNRGETTPINPRHGQAWWMAMPFIPDGLALSIHQTFEVSAVWACCNLITNSIAAAPWYVLGEDPNTGRRTKLVGDSLAYLLNTAASPEHSAQGFKESLIFQALIYGNGYAEIVRDGAGRVTELWPLLTDRMLQPSRDARGQLVYQYMNPDGVYTLLPKESVFHLRGPSLDGLMGQGTVLAAAKAIATAAAADRFTASYYANAATPSGILQTSKPLQPRDRDGLKQEFAAKYSSHRNNGKPIVLDSGMEWKPVSNDPQKSQLVEGRQFSVEEIARYFGVPLHLLASPQGSQGYGKNLAEMGHGLINFGLTPWARRLEQECQAKLIPFRSQKVTIIDLSYLSRGTEKDTAEADEIRIRSGVVTINECREALGYNHGPAELDQHLVLTTVQSLEKALAPPPAPLAPGAPAGAADEGDDGADPEADVGGQDGTGLADAAAVLRENERLRAELTEIRLVTALDSYARSWRAREKDLTATTKPEELPEKLERARADLRSEVKEKMGAEYDALCTAVEAGERPSKVAAGHLRGGHAPSAASPNMEAA